MADVTRALNERFQQTTGLSPQECLAEIDRLVSSPLLQSSDALCKLLQYLAHHTLYSPTNHLKEYQIATEVLGRSADYDPHSDSSVRVQVGRLRGKLAEYYFSAGTHDPVQIDVPKGRYGLTFERRITAPEPAHASQPLIRLKLTVGLAVLICALAVSGVLTYLAHRRGVSYVVESAASNNVDMALRTFWSPFLQSQDPPYVVISNAAFVGDPKTGMRYFQHERDSWDKALFPYTGIGDAIGVLELDRLFNKFGKEFILEPAAGFPVDLSVHHDTIYVGSALENLPLAQIPSTREFVFQEVHDGSNPSRLAIVDQHPQAGKTRTYFSAAQPTDPVEEEFALIALTHGQERSQRTLILEGTSTQGSEGAVYYLCDEDSVEGLLRELSVKSGEAMPFFEALVRVKVVNFEPSQTQLIAVRKIDD